MTSTQIQYFLAVAEYESFSKAAESLFVSHQVLSSQIKALEKELGVELINRRNKRKIVLTNAGRVLCDAWSDIIKIHEKALHQARKLQETEQNSLVIGIQDVRFVRGYVVPLIRKLQESSRKINLEYRLGSPEEILHMLESGAVDMLILISSDYDPELHYHRAVLCKDALHIVAAVSKNHPLAKKSEIRLEDLKNETICIFSNTYSNTAKKNIVKHCLQEGFTPKDLKYYPNMRSMEIAMARGDGVTIGYDIFFSSKRDALKFYPVNDELESLELVFAWKNELNKASTQLLNYLEEHLKGIH